MRNNDKKDHKVAYTVIERGEGAAQKKFWLKIGAAFENRDGSINVKLDAMPTNGQIQLRDYEPYRGRGASEAA